MKQADGAQETGRGSPGGSEVEPPSRKDTDASPTRGVPERTGTIYHTQIRTSRSQSAAASASGYASNSRISRISGVEEVGRELGDRLAAEDALSRLARAGLAHRHDEFVFPSRAAIRAVELDLAGR